METHHWRFGIVIFAAFRLSCSGRSRSSRAPRGKLQEPRPVTACVEENASYNEISFDLTKMLLGHGDDHHISSQAGKGQTDQVEIIWIYNSATVSVTTRLRITDKLDCDIVMKRDAVETLSTLQRPPLSWQPHPPLWVVPDSSPNPAYQKRGMVSPRSSEPGVSHQTNQQRQILRNLSQNLFHTNVKGLPLCNIPRPMHNGRANLSRTFETESNVSWDISDRESDRASLGLDYCDSLSSGTMTLTESSVESLSSTDSFSTEFGQIKPCMTPQQIFHLPKATWHNPLVIRGFTDDTVGEPDSFNDFDPFSTKDVELEDQEQSWGADSANAIQNPQLSEFEAHPGHKYWEWDRREQRWHRRGGSYESEMDWFPEEFV